MSTENPLKISLSLNQVVLSVRNFTINTFPAISADEKAAAREFGNVSCTVQF